MGFSSIIPVFWRRATKDRPTLSPPVSQTANISFSSCTLPDKSSLSETRLDDCVPLMMIVVVTVNSGRVSSIGQSESLTQCLQIEVFPATPINHVMHMCLWVRASRRWPGTSHKSMPWKTHQARNLLSTKHSVTTVSSDQVGGATAWSAAESPAGKCGSWFGPVDFPAVAPWDAEQTGPFQNIE